MKIGLIALGMIGSRMATNLQNDRRSQVLLNRRRDRVEALKEPSPISELAKRSSWSSSACALGGKFAAPYAGQLLKRDISSTPSRNPAFKREPNCLSGRAITELSASNAFLGNGLQTT